MSDENCTEREVELVEELFQRVASDLSMITDRDLLVTVKDVGRQTERPAGRNKIHIAIGIGIQKAEGVKHGCMLLPLADAISLACYLMMIPDDGVKGKRAMSTIDETIKDAMLEVGNFIGGAADAALREAVGIKAKVRAEGCQGVRPDIRPALVYNEGDSLVVGKAKGRIHDYPEFDLILMLPELTGVN